MENITYSNDFQTKAFLSEISIFIPEALDCFITFNGTNDSLQGDYADIILKVNIDGHVLFLNSTCPTLSAGISNLPREMLDLKNRFNNLISDYKKGEDIFFELSNFIYSQYLLDLLFIRKDNFKPSEMLDSRPFLSIASLTVDPFAALRKAYSLNNEYK